MRWYQLAGSVYYSQAGSYFRRSVWTRGIIMQLSLSLLFMSSETLRNQTTAKEQMVVSSRRSSSTQTGFRMQQVEGQDHCRWFALYLLLLLYLWRRRPYQHHCLDNRTIAPKGTQKEQIGRNTNGGKWTNHIYFNCYNINKYVLYLCWLVDILPFMRKSQGWWCSVGFVDSRQGYGSVTELPGVWGTGMKVLQNFQKFRVLWHGRTEPTEVPSEYKRCCTRAPGIVARSVQNS